MPCVAAVSLGPPAARVCALIRSTPTPITTTHAIHSQSQSPQQNAITANLVVVRVRREQPAVDHRLHILVAVQRRRRRRLLERDRVADARVLHRLDLRGEVADLARVERVDLSLVPLVLFFWIGFIRIYSVFVARFLFCARGVLPV